jgi:hypothetical protein
MGKSGLFLDAESKRTSFTRRKKFDVNFFPFVSELKEKMTMTFRQVLFSLALCAVVVVRSLKEEQSSAVLCHNRCIEHQRHARVITEAIFNVCQPLGAKKSTAFVFRAL